MQKSYPATGSHPEIQWNNNRNDRAIKPYAEGNIES